MPTIHLYDMAKMSVSGTPGTGVVVLSAAIAGFQSFAAAGLLNGQTFSYNITDVANSWEIGRGVYTSTGTSFTRGPIFSSNGNAAINATSNAQVTIVILAQDLIAASAIDTNTLQIINGTLYATGSFANATAAGSDQASAQTIAAQINYVGTVAAGTGVRVDSPSVLGSERRVINRGANPLQVYPTGSENIDNNGAGVAVTLMNPSDLTLIRNTTSTWAVAS